MGTTEGVRGGGRRLEVLDHHGGEQHEGGKLPGALEARVGDELPMFILKLEAESAVLEDCFEIKATAVAKVAVESLEDLEQNAGALPLPVAAITGLVGRVAGRHVVPGGTGADLPEDAVEHSTLVEEGTAQ